MKKIKEFFFKKGIKVNWLTFIFWFAFLLLMFPITQLGCIYISFIVSPILGLFLSILVLAIIVTIIVRLSVGLLNYLRLL